MASRVSSQSFGLDFPHGHSRLWGLRHFLVRWLLCSPCHLRCCLHIPSADSHLDHDHSLHIPLSESSRWFGHGPQKRRCEGPLSQSIHGVLGLSSQLTSSPGFDSDGVTAATGTDRAISDDSRYGRPDRLNDPPGGRCDQARLPETRTTSSPPGSMRPRGSPRPPFGS